MNVKPLTVSDVKNAKPKEMPYSLHDGRGLLLYVSPSGGRTWRIRYAHPITKKRQTFTIGPYPEFTLSEAREQRDDVRRMVSRGVDPNGERRERLMEQKKKYLETFENVALKWLSLKESQNLKQNYIKSITRAVKHYLVPAIGKMIIHDMTPASVIEKLEIYNDRPSIMDLVTSKLNEIMYYAVNIGIMKNNPFRNIRRAFKKAEDKPFTALPIIELPSFLAWWSDAKNITFRNGVLFQVLTMTRPNEALGAEWSEIDLEAALWTIPPERMKKQHAHVVPLSVQAVSLLKEMKNIKRSDFVFYCLNKPQKPVTSHRFNQTLAGSVFAGKCTLHGFRAMWSTLLNEEGFNPDVIEAALAHKSGNAIRDIYNRTTYLEQRRIMMQWLGDFFDSARAGVITRSGGHKGLRVVNQ